jgi:hypothetical protein
MSGQSYEKKFIFDKKAQERMKKNLQFNEDQKRKFNEMLKKTEIFPTNEKKDNELKEEKKVIPPKTKLEVKIRYKIKIKEIRTEKRRKQMKIFEKIERKK